MSYLIRVISTCSLWFIISLTSLGAGGVLSDGLCFKLEIGSTGIYEINGAWLNQSLGIELGSINISNLKIYGIPGGALNESSIWSETERLTEIPSYTIDEGNGILDQADKILFYAEGSSKWQYDPVSDTYDFTENPYTSEAYVILKISPEPRMSLKDTVLMSPISLSSQYVYRAIHHEDKTNLLGASNSHQGSGQEWFGAELSNMEEIILSSFLPKRLTNLEYVVLEAAIANRSSQTEVINISSNDNTVEKSMSPVNIGNIESIYARKASLKLQLDFIRPDQEIKLKHKENDNEARLWLDYLQIEGRSSIDFTGSTIQINNLVALEVSKDGLLVTNGMDAYIWDVTDPFNVRSLNKHSVNGKNVSISINTKNPQEIAVFDPSRTQALPSSARPIENQAISEIDDLDMLVISPEALKDVASKFTQHRSNYNNINIYQVSVEEVYNEYAAGRMDPTAIRNYIRDLYRNQSGLKYVLLLGDASYDYRYLLSEFPNENLIPTFETKESLDPLLAFPSDDYFALLDDGEDGQLRGDLDVAVGRLIVRNAIEAENVVDKIIRYDNAERSAGSWRTRLAFVADDEDNNLHINDADRIAEEVAARYPLFNQSKIYLDAFVQESTPGGNRYPSATNQLNQTVEQGALVLNFLGHGGPFGWTQERVLKVDDITNWSNRDRLPLIITATCSFTGFDDPALTTAGEAALLQPNGGGIALFTTVRSVFASKNFRLTQSVFREIFEKEEGNYLPIGEVMRRAKNNIPNDNTNARKFFMIGDPSMRLNIPNYEVITNTINLKVSDNDKPVVDTVGALDIVQLKGEIRNDLGDLAQDFNGELDITVFDKPNLVSTLANDNGSFRKEYNSQNNVIYKGKAAVEDGVWETSFRVPVDINYSFGQAKISYYALSSDQVEATGYTKQLAIEGSSNLVLNDDEGPEIQLYLNNRSFVSGTEVSPNNLLLADISDPSGLNLSTASIGHEMTAFIDDQTIILNDFFIPSTDITNSGTILYDLSELPPGRHELKVQAFDVANNVGSAFIDFVVSNEIENTLEDVTVSPNPISKYFVVSVNSDIRGSAIEMGIDFFDVSGKLLQKKVRPTDQNGNHYSAIFELNGRKSYIIMALIRLRDRISGEETTPVLKKIISLK
ncbi:MAG: hypothetical protein ACI9FN_001352 [Saprospiraceae bacterium]|jgi:hypothetical protein